MESISKNIRLKLTPVMVGTAKLLPASKSISNRALIINAMAGNTSNLHNLSDANDTQLMLRLVNSPEKTIDVEDAGTTMRFLTAFYAMTNQNKILTGTARMKERPIALLVDALRTLGSNINYLGIEGFPPHEIVNFSGQKTNKLSIRGDVSSQYISALMMVAPLLPKGLHLKLEGKIGSRPYIEMTASIMKHFGADCEFNNDTIIVGNQKYSSAEYTVESDWSAASYWFAFAALSENADILLPRLFDKSLQGDSVIAELMRSLGVTARMEGGLLRLTGSQATTEISWDFTHCPDLAQTVAVVCAVKGIKGNFTGLESLRIKETDRIAALQNELGKIGARLIENNRNHWTLIPSDKLPSSASFATYKDHRMAMAFAPLCTKMEVDIANPDVVRKSYPNFWNDLRSFGIEIN
jgi:3-phosphoshikimate 1-carboxyvinyltransferase